MNNNTAQNIEIVISQTELQSILNVLGEMPGKYSSGLLTFFHTKMVEESKKLAQSEKENSESN